MRSCVLGTLENSDNPDVDRKARSVSMTDLRTTVPFVAAHLEIFHCKHDPVIPESELYFTFCSTLRLIASLATAHSSSHKNHLNCLIVTISL